MTESRPGKSTRDPLSLCPCIRRLYLDMIERCHLDGVDVLLIETMRDAERQAFNIAHGVSWTRKSKHLPQPPSGLSLAFDLAPKDYLKERNWFPSGPLWERLGRYAEDIGLEWGGNWTKTPDRVHFQLAECECPAK